jgi:hypothetical protein
MIALRNRQYVRGSVLRIPFEYKVVIYFSRKLDTLK